MAASHSCVVLPLCLLLTCLSLTGAVVSEQQHVIVHHEPNNHDLLPYEISLIGRDVHLRQSLGGHHDRRPSVPAFVVAKMDAESIPRLAHAPSTKGPLRHPNPRDPEVPVFVSVRSEADPSQGRRRESYNNEVTPLKPSKMAVDPIVPIAVAPPTPRVNNYHRVLNRVLEQDIPLLHESPRSKGPIDLPDHQLNMKSPSAYASKMVPHIIRQVKNITLHYHVTNYHPASYAKSAGKRGQSPTTTTTPSPTTAPTDATTTTPEAAKEKASEEEMPSYVPSASEIMAAFLQGPLEQQLKMLQDVPVIQRRREVPNTSFTRSMATRNLRRSYHDRPLAMDSRVRRVRRRYPRRHAGFSERSYDVMGAASDEQPVKAEESTSSPCFR
ncbi:hypothetical protein HDE_03557 [Halotydeus destructor]|nr:hypothetical protein HDE_03557 [Halotydeus destructor]